MSWDLLEIVLKFVVTIYHAGGAKIRWVVWFWAAFVFLYLLLGQYDAIHKRTRYIFMGFAQPFLNMDIY